MTRSLSFFILFAFVLTVSPVRSLGNVPADPAILKTPAAPKFTEAERHTELAKRPWFAGEAFTAADVMMSFPLELGRARAGLDEARPNLIDWLERIHARPAYAAALKAGGPYRYA